jgi:hypothetical protein
MRGYVEHTAVGKTRRLNEKPDYSIGSVADLRERCRMTIRSVLLRTAGSLHPS